MVLSDPLYLFVFAGLFSPGPNVILLTHSGARFGFVASVPHLLGVVLGVGVIGAVAAWGVGALLLAVAPIVLQSLASAWIAWLAWRMLRRQPPAARAVPQPIAQAATERPMRFGHALAFQWVNPKIWAVAVAAVASYPGGLSPAAEAWRLGSALSGINLFVCVFWTCAGTGLAVLLRSERAWRGFNAVMAALLLASAAMVWI